MKKKNVIIVFALIVIIVLGLLIILGQANKQTMKDITVSSLQEKIDKRETFILYVKQDGCSHCEAFTPIFQQVLSAKKITAYVINLTSLKSDEQTKFNSIIDITGTPTTVFYKDGEVLDIMSGSKSATFVESKLQILGYVK